MGLPTTDDFSKEIWGAGMNHITVTPEGERCSTAKAFLVPILDRENLTIITNANAQKLNLKERNAQGLLIKKMKN